MGRLWKHKKTMNLTMTVDDPRVVMCLRKNQQPQRWEQKEVYEWFQTKCIKLYNECSPSVAKVSPFDNCLCIANACIF